MSARPRHVAGFSLIELLFSMTIGSIILILAATMLGNSGESYERVGGNVASEREARALLTQLASDLATARFHPDSVIEKSSATWPLDRLGFLCLQPAIAQTEAGRIGDLCAVHYYIKDLTIGGKTVRCLMRGFRESAVTFDALRDEQLPGLFVETSLDEPIAFGVVAFETRPKSRDAEGQWTDWVANPLTGPQAIEVKLVIARRELAGKLKLPADWSGSGSGTGQFLGQPAAADRNQSLEIFATTLRFGNHEGL
jgi:prepilin-type N-terminal cleavage/methylation domain-containing protein